MKYIYVFVFSALFFAIFLLFFSSYMDTTIVYWSYSKDECVKVIKNGVEYSCSEMPDKYERIWVK